MRALELVRSCEILVYDRLVASGLVSKAIGAARISRDGLTQEEVNELLVHHGRRGRKVVRLKGGDPFIFGRGCEEVEALAAAGIDYEVVPGVSTFTAVPGARRDPADDARRRRAADDPHRHVGRRQRSRLRAPRRHARNARDLHGPEAPRSISPTT